MKYLLSLLLVLPTVFCQVATAAENLDFKSWGLLAIQDGGRRKPIDTFASETLLRISGRSSLEADGRRWSPNDFLLSAILGTHDWEKEPIVLVAYRPLVEKLGLDAEKKRFAYAELAAIPALSQLATAAQQKRSANLELDRLEKEADSVGGRLTLMQHVMQGHVFKIAPPAAGDAWTLPTELPAQFGEERAARPMEHLKTLAQAYLAGDGYKLALNANQLRAALRELNPAAYPTDARLKVETFYNRADPFDWAGASYALGLLALVFAYNFRRVEWLWRPGVAIAFVGLLIHTAGIALRCYIAERPPVTNMYESVVWVSFGVVLCGFIFYARYRGAVYLLSALPAGFICLMLLSLMPVAMPEEIGPLVPVLRDNFWLVVHVLTIVSSYPVFLLACALGHVVLWQFIRHPQTAAGQATLHFWLYRVIQLGVLLLAAGTILGGVWANYSWGRFWGWDPKETWALIALLCYLFVLHGRVVGWWDQFGLALASVVCFCAVLMTWYGVNFVLGKGLHSYGFGLGGEGYVAAFVALDLAYVGVACVRYAQARRAIAAANGDLAFRGAVRAE